MYLGTLPKCKLATLKEVSNTYGISINHLRKVQATLSRKGLVETVPGRNGGIRLAVDPSSVSVGNLIRTIENLDVVECFKDEGLCILSPACTLKQLLHNAVEAGLKVLDRHTLADLIVNKAELAERLFDEKAVTTEME